MVLFVLYNENGFRSEIINVGKYCRPSIDHRNLIPCHCAFRTTQVFCLFACKPFDSQWQPKSALSTLLSSVDHCAMIQGRFLSNGKSSWSFNTISSRCNNFEVPLTMEGIIQENDRYKDEMDRLEKEVSRLRKLHASGGRDTGRRPECFWSEDFVEDKASLAPNEDKV